MSETSSACVGSCVTCGRLLNQHWYVVGGLNYCSACVPTPINREDGLSNALTMMHRDNAALRSRIATLERQVEQAREALEEQVCGGFCSVKGAYSECALPGCPTFAILAKLEAER